MDFGGGRKRPVRWFFAAPGALPIGVDNAFASLNWVDKNDWDGLGPGEDSNAPRRWSNGALPDPELNGRKPLCGPPEWWASGVPPDAPDLLYSLTSVPLCCRGPLAFLWIAEIRLKFTLVPQGGPRPPVSHFYEVTLELKMGVSAGETHRKYEEGTLELKLGMEGVP
jgi:hypothetical protein